MNYSEFRNTMEKFKIFSINDIEKMFPGFLRLNLNKWHKKGYIIKIRRGWYCFSDIPKNEQTQWLAANLIYSPSYISLQSALSFYNLIPEAIYSITSVTSLKTNNFKTPIGNFNYNNVKKSIFGFGHTFLDINSGSVSKNINLLPRKILFAEIEKAILDFFYINHQYNSEKEIEYLRFDNHVLENDLNIHKLFKYLDSFNSKSLNERIFKMMKVYALK